MGRIRLSYDDFCRCTPEEFEAVCKAWLEGEQADNREDWERMRMLATITVQPHVKGKLTPKRLLPFPWEKADKPKANALSAEDQRKRFEELKKRLN